MALLSPALQQATIRLQAMFRGARVRQQAGRIREAREGQSVAQWWQERNAAAVRIQAAWRGHRARKLAAVVRRRRQHRQGPGLLLLLNEGSTRAHWEAADCPPHRPAAPPQGCPDDPAPVPCVSDPAGLPGDPGCRAAHPARLAGAPATTGGGPEDRGAGGAGGLAGGLGAEHGGGRAHPGRLEGPRHPAAAGGAARSGR